MRNSDITSAFFTVEHNRFNTGAIKYHIPPDASYPKDLIPMWIADMDFKVPPEVETALVHTAQHGIFGYTKTDRDYDFFLSEWYKERFHWSFQSDWNIKTPGVMFSIAAAIRALTKPGDRIMICQPVYYPFAKIISANNRTCIPSALLLKNGRYEMNFEEMEEKFVRHAVKMILFCSPHNPVGRVWTEQELLTLGQICIKHHVFIVTDEIHSDFIYRGHQHRPLASVSEALADQTISCISPAKTFNLAGLQVANTIIKNAGIRQLVREACLATGYSNLNTMAITAATTAYQYGAPWFQALLAYLQSNMELLRDALKAEKKVQLIQPDGTYLMWLDCSGLHLTDKELARFFLEKAGLWLHSGSLFGAGGSGFMRMNIACPKPVLQRALQRLSQALADTATI